MVRWSDQFGTDEIDSLAGVAVDSNDNVYLAGSTEGLLGQEQVGQDDGFLRSYDSSGTVRWTVQFGSDRPDDVTAIASSGSTIYVGGATVGDLDGENEGEWDAFIMAFNTSGAELWVHQFGTEETDSITAIAANPSGTVYVGGSTAGELAEGGGGTGDGFVAAYSSGGSQQWLTQFGSSGTEVVQDVATHGSRVFVVGQTNGQMDDTENAGQWDAYVSSFSTSGGHQWTRQFGTAGYDVAWGVHTDASSNVYVVGAVNGKLGDAIIGGQDAFIRSYAAAGVLRGTRQFGTGTADTAFAVVVDDFGNIYSTGSSRGVMETGYSNQGQTDGYVRKHGPWEGL